MGAQIDLFRSNLYGLLDRLDPAAVDRVCRALSRWLERRVAPVLELDYEALIERTARHLRRSGVMVFGLHGKARCGKDTAAATLQEAGYGRLSFTREVRAALIDVFGLSRAQAYDETLKERVMERFGYTPRFLMQRFATEFVRHHVDENLWVRFVLDELGRAGPPGVSISDVRFPNEARMLRAIGAQLVVIERKDLGSAALDRGHESERGFALDSSDLRVSNDGSLEEYRAAILALASAPSRPIRRSAASAPAP